MLYGPKHDEEALKKSDKLGKSYFYRFLYFLLASIICAIALIYMFFLYGGFESLIVIFVLPLLPVLQFFEYRGKLRIDTFRIYSKGICFTVKRKLPDGTWSAFYSLDKISRITLEPPILFVGTFIRIHAREQDVNGKTIEAYTTFEIHDYKRLFEALVKVIPDERTRLFQLYLTRIEKWDSSGTAGRYAKNRGLYRAISTICLFFFFFGFYFVLLIPMDFENGYLSVMGIFACEGFSFLFLKYYLQNLQTVYTMKAVIIDGELRFQQPLFYRIFSNYPGAFKLDWISKIKLLKDIHGEKYCAVEFWPKLTLFMSYDLLKCLLIAIPMEKGNDEDDLYTNPKPIIPDKKPCIQKWKLALIFTPLIVGDILLGYSTINLIYSGSIRSIIEFMFSDWNLILPSAIILSPFILLAGLMAYRTRLERTEYRLGTVDLIGIRGGKEIHLIDRQDIDDVTLDDDFVSSYCRVRTRKGRKYIFPVRVYSLLTRKIPPPEMGLFATLEAELTISSRYKS